MKKQSRNHVTAFKAKVAPEAAKEEKTLTELLRRYCVHVLTSARHCLSARRVNKRVNL